MMIVKATSSAVQCCKMPQDATYPTPANDVSAASSPFHIVNTKLAAGAANENINSFLSLSKCGFY